MSFVEKFLGPLGPQGYNQETLHEFLRLRIEENLNLDYKHIKAFDDADKVCIAVSAFANGEGGLLVLGVKEDAIQDQKGNRIRVRPGAITWGEASLSRERVEQILLSRIHPPLDGVRVYPVRDDQDRVVFLIDVPQSLSPPHQAPDRKYYLRYNFENLPMEHYQIEALFGRRNRPDLRLGFAVSNVVAGEFGFRYKLRALVKNLGRVSAKYPLVVITANNAVFRALDGFRDMTASLQAIRGGPTAQYIAGDVVIYPGLVSMIGSIDFESKGDTTLTVNVVADEMPARTRTVTVLTAFLNQVIAAAGIDDPRPVEMAGVEVG